METKANYALVGFFTLLVVAAAFGFVYWMAQYGRSLPFVFPVPQTVYRSAPRCGSTAFPLVPFAA
jgi:ABC-type transporter Mla subunit MlaD